MGKWKMLLVVVLFSSTFAAEEIIETQESSLNTSSIELEAAKPFSSVLENAQEEVDPPTEEVKSSSYSEYFMMYELRNLRTDLERSRAELITDLEHTKANVKKSVTQVEQSINKTQRETISSSVDLMTNFFYFVTVVISFLALAGWRTLNELKSSARRIVEKEVEKLIGEFEERLKNIESDLRSTGENIIENQRNLENVQKLHTIWSQASREKDDAKRVELLNEILELEEDSEDAMIMKSSSYLRLDLPEQAIESCNLALEISQNNPRALYNRACAYAQLDDDEKVYADIRHALSFDVGTKDKIPEDRDLSKYLKKKEFKELLAEF